MPDIMQIRLDKERLHGSLNCFAVWPVGSISVLSINLIESNLIYLSIITTTITSSEKRAT